MIQPPFGGGPIQSSSLTYPYPSEPRQRSAWTSVAALVIAVIAVILAIIGWFRPLTGPGTFSSEQRQEAKSSLCESLQTVMKAVRTNTNMTNPVPGNRAGALAVSANARLALFAGGQYLEQRLGDLPATPGDLKDAAAAYANTLQTLSINYLAGHAADDSVQQPLRDVLGGQADAWTGICQQ
ncbi:MAG: hypothetical protein ABI307_12865 [Mycobacterium sp.]